MHNNNESIDEVWADIADFEGLYKISNKGRIKNTIRNNNLKYFINKQGYVIVKLSKNGVRYSLRVHRLMAQSFIPNPNNYPIINHKDEDKSNYCLSNLEWCNHKYNNTYGSLPDRKSEWSKRPVIKLSKSGSIIREYESVNDAGIDNNVHPSNISNCLKERNKTSAGYRWKYK
ncbi:MAG: NUMOD4 domain-containing protein [Dysgonomonas sp.]